MIVAVIGLGTFGSKTASLRVRGRSQGNILRGLNKSLLGQAGKAPLRMDETSGPRSQAFFAFVGRDAGTSRCRRAAAYRHELESDVERPRIFP